MEWMAEEAHRSRTVRENSLLRAGCVLSPLPMLWDRSNMKPSYNDPIQVIVDKNPVVNITLLNESPLVSFPSQNTELSKEIVEANHSE